MNDRIVASPGKSVWRDRASWLWTLLPIVTGLMLCNAFYAMATDRELWAQWSRWIWLPQWPMFNDLWITLEHLRESTSGADLLADPNTEFAYPRAVLLGRYTHIQDLPSPLLGTLQAATMMSAIIFILRPRTLARAALATLSFFAPPVMLGFTQGNIDLALFVTCVVIACWWARAETPGRIAVPVALTWMIALLKLYPAFALVGGAWTDSGRRRLVWVAAILIAGVYWASSQEEIRLIMSKQHLGANASWGCVILFQKIKLLHRDHALEDLAQLWPLSAAIYSVAFLIAASLGHRARRVFTSVLPREEWALFWIGAAICAGSFLVSNYAYRWVFALLTLPLLLHLVARAPATVAWWARLTFLALAVSLAARLDVKGPWFFITQSANWLYLLLVVFGYSAFRSQPSDASAPLRASRAA